MTREPRHRGLLVTLTAAAASTDAISYLGLGHVFPANMTGNTVLLAVGIADRDYASAARSAVALGGFVLGASLAAATESGRGWTRRLIGVLLGELVLLAAASGWWLGLDAHPNGVPRLGLIALLSVAMGSQSGAIAGLGVGVSTTYITGTWTAVSGWVATRLRPGTQHDPTDPDADQRTLQVAVLVCYFALAIGSGYLFHAQGAVAALIAVAAVAAVCAGAPRSEPTAPRRPWISRSGMSAREPRE